ncbi:LmbE-like protein, partial [Auriculariales sp. MPI-PUGE-AT-0066]
CLGKRALLLTAHPDDECMFFAPTVHALVKNPDVQVYSLCLSNGNADGIGDIRGSELRASLDVLGIPANQSELVNHSELQDIFTHRWDAKVIASVVEKFVRSHGIDTILTFDAGGVSGHPNHVSLPAGAALVSGVRIAVLKTTGVTQKYSSFLDKAFIGRTSSTFDGAYVSNLTGYIRGVQAMMAHWSQLVWFRWLYISFSRYMWTNEWTCIN